MHVEQKLQELGLTLPPPATFPPGVEIPFAWTRVHRDRVFVSGHGALDESGSPAGPFGKVPSQVSLEEAQHSAVLTTLAILSSIRQAIGDLDRVTAWLTVNGHINADPGYARTTAVMNPASALLLDLYGTDAGTHARTAIGVAALPLDLPVIIAAEVEFSA